MTKLCRREVKSSAASEATAALAPVCILAEVETEEVAQTEAALAMVAVPGNGEQTAAGQEIVPRRDGFTKVRGCQSIQATNRSEMALRVAPRHCRESL